MTSIILISKSIMLRGLFSIINNFLRNNKRQLKLLAQEYILNNIFEDLENRDSSKTQVSSQFHSLF